MQNFADKILSIIKSNNKEGLKNLSCFPNQYHCVGNKGIKYVFGNKNVTGEIRSILISKNIEIKIFGPFTHEEKYPDSSYAIVYYKPELVQFNKKGYMDKNTRETQWNKGYVETLVTVIKGKVHLHRTIFYYGAHLPWVGEHG